MKKLAASLAILFAVAAHVSAQRDLPPLPSIEAAANAVASPTDTARFLAGLPVPPDSPLAPFMRDVSWTRHAAFFDKQWAKLESGRLQRIRAWQAEYVPEASEPTPVVYYMFSGPDFLYLDQFFPAASVYVLCGREEIGPLPNALRLGMLASALENLETALNSALNFSFFITRDMKTDLQRTELQGVLPILYVFLARAGKVITDVSFVSLNNNGTFEEALPAKRKAATPGVRISYYGPNGAPQTLFYFMTDLSDDGIKKSPGFIKFCERFGSGLSFLKCASYLMHESGFNSVRSFLLKRSDTIVQDDSGIPITSFSPELWRLRLFGSYPGPIELFQQHLQPLLQQLYAVSNPPPLDFGVGYRWNPRESTLIIARKK